MNDPASFTPDPPAFGQPIRAAQLTALVPPVIPPPPPPEEE